MNVFKSAKLTRREEYFSVAWLLICCYCHYEITIDTQSALVCPGKPALKSQLQNVQHNGLGSREVFQAVHDVTGPQRAAMAGRLINPAGRTNHLALFPL